MLFRSGSSTSTPKPAIDMAAAVELDMFSGEYLSCGNKHSGRITRAGLIGIYTCGCNEGGQVAFDLPFDATPRGWGASCISFTSEEKGWSLSCGKVDTLTVLLDYRI